MKVKLIQCNGRVLKYAPECFEALWSVFQDTPNDCNTRLHKRKKEKSYNVKRHEKCKAASLFTIKLLTYLLT